jgi:hypothetical protein
MIEHMFELLERLTSARESAVEVALQRLLHGSSVDGAVREPPVPSPTSTCAPGRAPAHRAAPGAASAAHPAPGDTTAPHRLRSAPFGPPATRVEARLAEVGAAFAAGAAHLAELRQAQAEIGRHEARRARALTAFAHSRPASLDRPDAEVGAAAAASRAARPSVMATVSEWAVDEVAVALGMSGSAASRLLTESLHLVTALPGTLGALERGQLSWSHVRVLTDLVAPLPDDVRAQAEQRLLCRLTEKTPAQLRVAARRVVQRLDAATVSRRVREAVRDRRVSLYPAEDGMATLSATLPSPVARAVHDALAQYADAAATDGDERTKGQRMADCLVDLVLRPGEHGLAPVQARLTVVAAVRTLLGGDEPGEVDGDLVPAEMVRELCAVLGLLPHAGPPADSATVTELPTGDAPPCAPPDVEAADRRDETESDEPRPDAAASLTDLLGIRTVQATALAHRPHIALVDELTGSLIALTDAAGLRSGRGLGPPPASPGYQPSAELDRFVRTRDRRCRFPGCRARPITCDLDHTVPWPDGRTCSANLCCLCRHHHRLSHQAVGWRLRSRPGGALEWTTPTGQLLTTSPPRYGTDDDVPPDATSPDTTPADTTPPDTTRGGATPGTPTATPRNTTGSATTPQDSPDDSPPPF